MKRNIVIYKDEGVGEFGLSCLEQFFREDDVWLANAEAIMDGRVLQMADIFVMPGGADLPYCKKLNGIGNDNIRAFVADGGTYLGICAGAYYACSALEFHKGRDDEISGPRELALIDAVAYGSLPALGPYYDLTPMSASVVGVNAGGKIFSAYYHGGPSFRLSDSGTEIYAQFQNHPGPAILTQSYGDGRVVLSGVHLEISAKSLETYPVETAEEDSNIKFLASRLADSPSTEILRELIA